MDFNSDTVVYFNNTDFNTIFLKTRIPLFLIHESNKNRIATLNG